ncbi:MAG TPA: family 10 glycosylhydrolase [Gemmatimonadaceae bacterium]|nr:family 10 glycosylhydrolase [Gemmatimonadaceae bacterium]
MTHPYRTLAPLARGACLVATLAAIACTGTEAPVASPEGSAAAPRAVGGPEVKLPYSDARLMVRTPSAAAGERGGTTLALSAVLEKKNGKEKYKDKHISWSSTAPAVASVDSSGLVTAQDTGTAHIIATYLAEASDGHAWDTLVVRVVPVPVVSVTVVGVDSVSIDDSVTFAATPRDSVGEPLVGRTVAWSSTEPGVARVEAGGLVVAQAEGNTEIRATVEEVVGAQALRVWVQPVASVSVSPDHVSVPQFHKVAFSATARDRRGKILTGRAVTWASSDPAIFYIKANADTAAGKDLGSAIVTATVEGVPGTAAVTVTAPVEARALWVTRFEYTTSSAVDFAKIQTIMQKAGAANFNVVYFQVRTSGDALYFSDLEPCSPRMCGKLGGTRPAQDPLDVALAAAAANGLQLHAWVNAYTGFIGGSATACNQFVDSEPMNWLRAHPEWSVSTKNFTTGVRTRQVDNCVGSPEYMYVSPGVPEVRAQLARVTADLARRYGPKGLKGIHLDRIRYPSNQVSYDDASQEAFRAATGAYPTSNAQAAWLNARRGFVTQGVRDVYDSVRAVDPSLVISAAVFPAYQPRTGWSAAWSYTDYFQDPVAWAQAGALDVELPMNYPATATSTSWTVKAYCSNTDWTCVLDDHIQRIERGTGRHVYVGVGAIKGWTEVQKQLDLAHDRSATGMSVYSYSHVDNIPGGWQALAAGPFKHKATIPAMSWK